jgi:hypothetical protein
MKNVDLESVEALKKHHAMLENIMAILEDVDSSFEKYKPEEKMSVYIFFHGVLDSLRSLLILIPYCKTRDCYVIGRTIFEAVLNLGLIQSDREKYLDKAFRHMNQKSFRGQRRELKIGDFKIVLSRNGIEKTIIPKELQEMLDEFTKTNGQEIRDWTKENSYKKVEIIGNKFGDKVNSFLSIALFCIYREASEYAHGTLYGFMMDRVENGESNGNNTVEKYADSQRSKLCILSVVVGLIITSMLEIIKDEFFFEKEAQQVFKCVKNTLITAEV